MTLIFTGNNLRMVRDESGLSQRELSEQVHMAQSLISEIERGIRKPWPEVARRLSCVLKVSPSDLFPEGITAGRQIMY